MNSPSAGPDADYVQPSVSGRGEDGDFWTTSFAVIVPGGHWEAVDSPAGTDALCKPVEEDKYQLVNDRGVLVAAFEQPQLLVFTRATAQVVDGACQVEVAATGDFQDDLGNGYSLTNGVLHATFTPQELFSGQRDGTNAVAPLIPVAAAGTPPSQPPATTVTTAPPTTVATTTAPAPTTAAPTTTPPTTAAPTTKAPTTRPPTTAAPTTAKPTTAPDVYYPNCDAVRAAGKAPLHRGDPGYRSALDRDGDGTACDVTG